MAVRKKAKKAVKAPTKKIKKDIKSLRRGLKKEASLSKKVSKRTSKNTFELELLKRELENLKKRKKRAGLSEYNKFMRTQIRKGLSFKQAARLWNARKKNLAKKNRKRSGYNIFISIQLRQGKTMKQAIRAWNRLKNPPKKKRRKAKRIVVARKAAVARKAKRSRARPKRKPKARPKRRVVVRRKKAVSRSIVSERLLSQLIASAVNKAGSDAEKRSNYLKEFVSKKTVTAGPAKAESDEDLALRLLKVYFMEVARHGLKRSLSLDEVIDAYFYSLKRVERKDIELKEICKAIKKSKF